MTNWSWLEDIVIILVLAILHLYLFGISLMPLASNSFTECGGEKSGPYGYLSSPNHPGNYPHHQVRFSDSYWSYQNCTEIFRILMSRLPLAVHLVCICRGGSRGHAELQELQPGDAGCVRVWLRGGLRQCRHWGWKSIGKVRESVLNTAGAFVWSTGRTKECNYESNKPSLGSVGPACPLTWPRPAPTWPWRSWLMKELPTAASTQHTRLYQCWTVSSCFDLTSDHNIFSSPLVFFFNFLFIRVKGRVVPTSLPAVQASVSSRSGCVTDGVTALMVLMNRAAATLPILHSVSLCLLWGWQQAHLR